jgi:KipI family sensor histidine kinase inhibitor
MNRFALEPLGDSALLVRLGDRIDTATNRAALALADMLRAAALPGIRDIAPAYASVCVHYDVAAFANSTGAPHLLAAGRVSEIAAKFFEAKTAGTDTEVGGETPMLEIPVRYGGEFGPDLGDVAAQAGIDEQAVIERHANGDYRVAMLGFMPGFPYLLGLDESLHTPRREPAHARAGRIGRDRRRADRHLSTRTPWRLAADRAHAARAVRSNSRATGPAAARPARASARSMRAASSRR